MVTTCALIWNSTFIISAVADCGEHVLDECAEGGNEGVPLLSLALGNFSQGDEVCALVGPDLHRSQHMSKGYSNQQNTLRIGGYDENQ